MAGLKTAYKILMVFVGGGLSMFDVYSDYIVLVSLRNEPVWYNLTLAIIIFAAIAITYQLYRSKIKSDNTTYLCILISSVQLHWFVLFGKVMKSKGETRKWQQWAAWYERTVLLEVILESVPQLLLQSYIVIRRANDNAGVSPSDLQAQFISIGFSFLMASKTLFVLANNNLGALVPNGVSIDERKAKFSTPVYLALFTLSSLISRSLLIIICALFLQKDFFYVFGGMCAVRLLYTTAAKFIRLKVFRADQLISDVQFSVAAVFRDYYNSPFYEILSLVEVVVIAYLIFVQKMFQNFTESDALKQTVDLTGLLLKALIGSTSVRVFFGIIIDYLIKKDRALLPKKEDPGEIPAPEVVTTSTDA